MAGIGFELKKLFKKRSILSNFAGMIYSTFATIGHMLLIIIVLFVINLVMKMKGFPYNDKEVFSAIVLYSFIFSLLFSSGIAMVISRYIADKMFKEQFEDILPCMYGTIALNVLFSGIIGVIFYSFSPLSLITNIAGFLLFMQLGVIFILMVFVSAIKEYKFISYSFLVGSSVIIALVIICANVKSLWNVPFLLISMDIGFFIIMVGIFLSIKKFFTIRSNNYFDFLKYFQKYWKLFLINLLYTLGLYSHNFVMWVLSDLKTETANIFHYAADYDMATFVAMLTILPVTVMFVVRTETNFYDFYKEYLYTVRNSTYSHIEKARKDMILCLGRELVFLIEIQFIISLFLIIVGIPALQTFGLSWVTIDIFPFLAGGYYFSFLMFVVMTVLIYFQNYNDAIKIGLSFAVLNVIFTYITIRLGPEFYGLGMIGAGLVCLVSGIERIVYSLNSINYVVFCSQALVQDFKKTRFEKIIDFIDK